MMVGGGDDQGDEEGRKVDASQNEKVHVSFTTIGKACHSGIQG